MYGMPQPTAYGQYGFGAYGSYPGQGAAAPGAAGPGSPGMPQAVAAGAAGLGLNVGAQQPGGDINAPGAQPGQPQWGAADPNSYYSNYWGGVSFLDVELCCYS